MLNVPLRPVPAQTLSINVEGQPVQLSLRATEHGLFVTTSLDDAPVASNVIAHDRNLLVRSVTSPLRGDFLFADLQGADAPTWEALGTRFFLLYLDANEVAAYIGAVGAGH